MTAVTVGERIKEARAAKGLTQKELAQRLGSRFQSIQQWETGKRRPKFENIRKLAAALEVPESQLLGLEEKASSKEQTETMILGERLKAAREKAGLSVEQLAELVGLNKSTVYHYEKGDIKSCLPDNLRAFSSILNTTPAFLLGLDEPPEARKPEKGISLKDVLDMAKSFQGKNDAVTIENTDGDKFYAVLARPGYRLCWEKLPEEHEFTPSAPAVPAPEAKAPEAPQHDTLPILKVKGGEERPMYEAIINLCGIRGITLARLCFDLNICRADIQALNRYQNGFISEPTLEKIAQYLNTTPADLKKEADRMKGARQCGISSPYKENVDPVQNTLKISRQYEPSRHFVELTPETFQEIQSLAKSSGRSMDYLVEALLEFALARVTVVEEDRSAK